MVLFSRCYILSILILSSVGLYSMDRSAQDGSRGRTIYDALMNGRIDELDRVNFDKSTMNDMPYLLYFAKKNVLVAVRSILHKKANPNIVGIQQETPLHYAARNGSWDIIEALIGAGADVNARDEQGRTPLYDLIGEDECDIVRDLMRHGAEIDGIDNAGQTPLLSAIKDASWEVVRCLLEEGVNPDISDSDKKTPLHWAVLRDSYLRVRLLIKAKASLDVYDHDGKTPLYHAVIKGQEGIVELLLENGANPSCRNKHGQSPLHWSKNEKISLLLIKHGADVGLADNYGVVPLHRVSHVNVARAILEKDPSQIKKVTKQGITSLIFAITTKNIDKIKLLVDRGANVNQKSVVKQRAPLHWLIRLFDGAVYHDAVDTEEYESKKNNRYNINELIAALRLLNRHPGLNILVKDEFGNDVFYYIEKMKFESSQQKRTLIEVINAMKNG